MGKNYFRLFILAMIISLALLVNITRPAQAQEQAQEQKTKSLMGEITDVLELKNGNKIFGRVTGSASGAVTIFNMETGEEEIIRTNTISNQRKTTAYEVQAVIDELRDRGREDEIIPILNKRKEAEYGLSTKSYDEQVKSADRARDSLDKELDIAHREDREDELLDRARREYLEDRKSDQMNIDNSRPLPRAQKPLTKESK